MTTGDSALSIKVLSAAPFRARAVGRRHWLGEVRGEADDADNVIITDALVMLRKAVVRPAHRLPESQRSNDNVITRTEQGNSRAYTLTRLQRHRPDLYGRVKAIITEQDEKRLLKDVIASVPPLGKHGGDRRSDKAREQGASGTLKRGGNNVSYLAQRINRDHPDIAAAVERGAGLKPLASPIAFLLAPVRAGSRPYPPTCAPQGHLRRGLKSRCLRLCVLWHTPWCAGAHPRHTPSTALCEAM
jgi:hypothetical protein